MGKLYKSAGVDVDAGERSAGQIAKLAKKTMRPEVLSEIGGFAGLFMPDLSAFSEPVLVSATDGVGTKTKIAQQLNNHKTIGIDLVAMCVNDILTIGAQPLFFLDYIATGKLVEEKIATIVAGVADGCYQAGCSLLGGETAEHPGVMAEDDYDLAGFSVGITDRHKIVDGKTIEPGDKIIGIASSGLHSNGFSLVRKVFFDNPTVELSQKIGSTNTSLGEMLLAPTRIYVKTIKRLLQNFTIKGMVHITGGGITKNLPRILPDGLSARIDPKSWERQEIFAFLQNLSGATDGEMFETFNMGIGFILVVSPNIEKQALAELIDAGEKAWSIGAIIEGNKEVIYQ